MNILFTNSSGVFREEKGTKAFKDINGNLVEARTKGRWYNYCMMGDVPSVSACTGAENKEYNAEFNVR